MAIISINELRSKYKELNKYQNKIKEQTKKFNYLHLSIHFSRDEREFDYINYKLLKYFRKVKSEPKRSGNFISEQYIFLKYLNSFKEYKYLISLGIPMVILKDILVFLERIFDTSIVFTITFFSILINKIKGSDKDANALNNTKIYSIYYWNKKGEKSAEYYYPGIGKALDSKAYIISYADCKFFSYSYFKSIINSSYLSPAKTLNYKGLFLSVIQFFHLFFYDLYLPFKKQDYHFLKFWFGWKRIPEIFYSLLIYNSVKELANNCNNCEFISWYENQIMLRSFSLAVSHIKKISNTKCILSTYNGTPFTINNKNQYLPNREEIKIGFWGSNYYLQDLNSLEEMKNYLDENNLSLKLKAVPKSMKRFNCLSNKNLRKIDSKGITIFTSDTKWDLFSCLISLFNPSNFNKLEISRLNNKSKIINIRLHPSLDQKKIISFLKNIKLLPKDIKFNFVDNITETIVDTMQSSELCIFGESAYSNMAIEMNLKVMVVETSHLYKAPIRKDLNNSPNLFFKSPW